jgi:hypothetical protein
LGSYDPKLIREHVDFHQVNLMRNGTRRMHGCYSHASLEKGKRKKYNREMCIKKLFLKAQ